MSDPFAKTLEMMGLGLPSADVVQVQADPFEALVQVTAVASALQRKGLLTMDEIRAEMPKARASLDRLHAHVTDTRRAQFDALSNEDKMSVMLGKKSLEDFEEGDGA